MAKRKARMGLVEIDIRGVEEIHRAIDQIKKPASRRKITRPAVGAAAAEIVKQAKKHVPKESGLLRKSLGSKTWTKGDVVAGLAGPRRGFKQQAKRKNTWKGATLSNPVKYAHLVEFGTRPGFRRYTSGPLAGREMAHPGTRPRPFLRPAMQKADTYNIIRKRMAQEFIKERAKAAAKGKRFG